MIDGGADSDLDSFPGAATPRADVFLDAEPLFPAPVLVAETTGEEIGATTTGADDDVGEGPTLGIGAIVWMGLSVDGGVYVDVDDNDDEDADDFTHVN